MPATAGAAEAAPLRSELAGVVALRSAAAVRERCGEVFRWVEAGRSPHFRLGLDRLDATAAYVAAVTRDLYPDLNVPFHSRWRHFNADGVDRWAAIRAAVATDDPLEATRVAIDLAVVSVLLDAGAGDRWSYRDEATGRLFQRSEGLAVASLAAFRNGLFSSDPALPCRVDASALQRLDEDAFRAAFQVRDDNPLIGVGQRAALLRRLGQALEGAPDYFGQAPARPGHLIDFCRRQNSEALEAGALLAVLLDGLSSIWPSGLVLDGVALGDAGRHPAVRRPDRSNGIVPFHKLSQWMTYSLLEPIAEAGLRVTGIDGLTGLPEYRNGGLFLDFDVVRPRHPADASVLHEAQSELVVEWRALTVVLLDLVADPVRRHLGVSAETFPMAKILEGGTWAAGRRIARERRPAAGRPPLAVRIDGSVF